MSHHHQLGATFAAVLIASLFTPAGPSQAGAPASAVLRPAVEQSRTDQPRTVTLITGDRVTVHPRGAISVPPRDGVRYLDYSYQGHHYVIPSDVLPPLRDGRLDRRLFDVTGLLEAGYDRRDTLPLLITGGAPQGIAAARALPAIKGYAVKATPQQLRAQWKTLASQQGTKVWLDGLRKPSLDVTIPQIGAPAAWAAGFDGTGVKVAVLDTGIDSAHPDLAGKVAAAHNFTEGAEDGLDRVGHGTHVASTIVGSGAASDGRYKGVAPGASLWDGKVCVDYGCSESWILNGMQWAAESGANVINMSLTGDDYPEIDPLEQAVNNLTAQYGTLFVIAAGNSGPGDYTLGSPASAEAALAVGAVDKSDALAGFSSRGPRNGDTGLKPEITGPGVDVTAARSKDAFPGEPYQPYTVLSGTSMATPHVAGAAAILTQQHPQWTAQQRKAILTGSAQPNPTDGPFAQGAGRVNVARAITANISSDPVTLSFGEQTWPHEDDPVLTKDVTYTNTGTTDMTLQLVLSDTVSGTFSLSASSVTVPAGGSATVALTADTRQGTGAGPLGGRIVATGNGASVQTPYGVDREEPQYNLQFVHTDRAGHPAENYLTAVINLETSDIYYVSDPDGTDELRLPGGEYEAFSWIDMVIDGRYANTSLLMWPKLTVAADQTLPFDARTAGGYQVSIPDKTVTQVLATAEGTLQYGNRAINAGVTVSSFDQLYTGHLGPKPVTGFTSSAQGIWAKVNGPQILPDPVYTLAWQQKGSLFQGFIRDMRPRDLATVQESTANAGAGYGAVMRFPLFDNGRGLALELPQQLPASSTHIFNTDLAWDMYFYEYQPSSLGFQVMSSAREYDKRYEPGRVVHETFNRGVFGPALPPQQDPGQLVSRSGDDIFISGRLYSDRQGRDGYTQPDDELLTLYRNGELVGQEPGHTGTFTVSPEPARYRAEISTGRSSPFRLSTRVSVAWSFNSSHVDGITLLPVTTIGFLPQLDDYNTARAGTHLLAPIDVRQQKDSDAKTLRTLSVSVSYDDGITWHEAKTLSLLGRQFVLLKNPSAAGFVSLRAIAEDRAGNAVEQTIIRAYEAN